jgi:starvation-inducible DNA-binding protein
MTQTNILLDFSKSEKLSKSLNSLLSDYSMFFMNARGFHWNVKGEHFFEMHAKFEELYNFLNEKVDQVAERIISIGFVPNHSYKSIMADTSLDFHQNVINPSDSVKKIVDDFKKILEKQRLIHQEAEKSNDIGTVNLMEEYIFETEKLIWMYSAYNN